MQADSTRTHSAARGETAAMLEFVGQLGRDLSRGTLNLPSFPDALMRIQRVLLDDNATTRRVAEAVQAEPAFTAQLFRMANSVMLRRGDEPLTDLGTVINRLGFSTIKNLAVALSTRQLIAARGQGSIRKPLRALWAHSVDTAAIACVLARHCGRVPADDALLAGLLHDIGVFYIYSRMSAYPVLFEDPAAVAEIMSSWHTGIGHAILEEWEFPIAICAAVEAHENLDHRGWGGPDLAGVIVIANLSAHPRADTQRPAEADLAALPALAAMDLTPETLGELLEREHEAITGIKDAIGGI